MYFCRSFIVAGEDTMTSGLNSIKADYLRLIVTYLLVEAQWTNGDSNIMITITSVNVIILSRMISAENCSKQDYCWGTSESPTIDATNVSYDLYGFSNNGAVMFYAYSLIWDARFISGLSPLVM